MNPYDVIFEQNNLNGLPGVMVTNHQFNKLPSREIAINKLARRDMSIITSSEYSQKEILVFADVCGGDRGETEAVLTLLKQLVQAQNGKLQVMQNGYEVQYTATMNEFNFEWLGTKAIVTIQFIASDPLGRTVDLLTFATYTHTAAQSSVTGVFTGSGTIEPVISLTINSVTGGTGKDINIFNGRTNQGITLTGNWNAGDIIIIDSASKKATVNGGLVDFSGIFAVFAAGTQQVGITDTLTSRNISVSVSYYARFS